MSDFISLACPSCGHAFPVADKAHISEIVSKVQKCPACGVASILEGSAGNYWLETYAACPKCQKNDKAKKVTGFSKTPGGFYGYWNPPEKPAKKQYVREAPPDRNNGIFLSCGIIFVFGVAFFLCFGCAMWSFPTGLLEGDLLANSPLVILSTMVLPLSCIAVGLIVFIILVSQYVSKITNDAKESRRQKEYSRTEEQRMKTEIPVWERAMKRYDMVYYCERDDIVFIPATNEYDKPERLKELLYR